MVAWIFSGNPPALPESLDKITTVIPSQHCTVHFLRKGTLHGNEIFPLKAQLPAGFYN